MDFAEPSAHEAVPNETPAIPVIALASSLAFVAAASLLVWSLFPAKKRNASIVGQVALGILAGSTAAVIWNKRQEEAAAAHHLLDHIHEVRDTRWLKKHPIAYG
jgi:uncharacterized membrane protein YqjE